MLLPIRCGFKVSDRPGSTLIESDSLFVGKGTNGSVYKIYLSFNLDSLPMNIRIESAFLNLYAIDSFNGNKPVEIYPYMIVSPDSTDNKICWDNQPNCSNLLKASACGMTSYGWCRWQIKNLLRECLEKEYKDFGIMLEALDGLPGSIKKFVGRNHSYGKNRPFLEIKYLFSDSVTLCGRDSVSRYECHRTVNSCKFSVWQEIKMYSMYTYFVQNTGENPAVINVQLSPDQHIAYSENFSYIIKPNMVEAIVPQKYGFYSRLSFKSYYQGESTYIKIWFQAQV